MRPMFGTSDYCYVIVRRFWVCEVEGAKRVSRVLSLWFSGKQLVLVIFYFIEV